MKKILVIDDEPAIGRVLCRLLSQDYTVTYAPSVDCGLGFLLEGGYHLILTDVDMPGRSGLDGIADMRTLCPRVRIIVMTGSCTEADRAWIMAHGADDYIAKPFTLQAMQDIIALQLSFRRTTQVCGSMNFA